MLICKTPFRVSLFGGGTDHPSWFQKNRGYTISFTIDKYCYVAFRSLPKLFKHNYRLRYFKNERVRKISDIKHPSIKAVFKKYLKKNISAEVVHSSDIPGLSGLGSSSAFTVSLIKLLSKFNKLEFSKKRIAQDSIYLERKILKENVGCQDQYACSFGGFNLIKYKKNKINLKKVNILGKNRKKLIDNLLLVYSNINRKSDPIEKDKIKNLKANKKILNELNFNTIKGKKLLETKLNISLEKVAELLNQNWSLKKKLSNLVSNTKIDRLYNFGMKNGAIGGKLLGAGGGGYVLFLTKNQNYQKRLIKKLGKRVYFKFDIDHKGSEIIYNSYE